MTKLKPLIDSWELALVSENKSERTIQGYLESLMLFERWLDEFHPAVMPEDVTTQMCREWLVHLADGGRKPSTVRTRYGGLKQFFRWCHSEEEIDVDPMLRVKAPHVPEIPVPVLSAEKIRAVLDTTRGSGFLERRDRALLMLYLDTGARLSAIAKADLGDLDLRERTLRVKEKGRKERVGAFGAATARDVDPTGPRRSRLRSTGSRDPAAYAALHHGGADVGGEAGVVGADPEERADLPVGDGALVAPRTGSCRGCRPPWRRSRARAARP